MTPTVLALGLSQTLAWGSTYYLPAVLAGDIARDTGVSTATVFAVFSLALLVSGPLGPWAGRHIDRLGGRALLMGTNGVFALGLVLLSQAQGLWGLVLAWTVLGLAMGCGLYDAAFATLVRLHGERARNGITGITLMAGLASTVGWPLSTWMANAWGWQGACLGWAALHLLLGLPLNASIPRAPALTDGEALPASAPGAPAQSVLQDPAAIRAAMWRLGLAFAVAWFTVTAMASHLPRLLQAHGLTLAAAVGLGALLGPSQVAGRLLEMGWLRRWHPQVAARLASLGHPLGAGALWLAGGALAPVFVALHGLGAGMLTIAKGALPLALFGPHGYGARLGVIMLPSRIAQGAAPWLFGLALDAWGGAAIGLTALLGWVVVACLWTLPQPASARHGQAQAADHGQAG